MPMDDRLAVLVGRQVHAIEPVVRGADVDPAALDAGGRFHVALRAQLPQPAAGQVETGDPRVGRLVQPFAADEVAVLYHGRGERAAKIAGSVTPQLLPRVPSPGRRSPLCRSD